MPLDSGSASYGMARCCNCLSLAPCPERWRENADGGGINRSFSHHCRGRPKLDLRTVRGDRKILGCTQEGCKRRGCCDCGTFLRTPSNQLLQHDMNGHCHPKILLESCGRQCQVTANSIAVDRCLLRSVTQEAVSFASETLPKRLCQINFHRRKRYLTIRWSAQRWRPSHFKGDCYHVFGSGLVALVNEKTLGTERPRSNTKKQ